VFRTGGEVLLVHRPKYDDWSFPKGKLDPGESAPAAAVREVEEETGLRIVLCRPVSPQRYPVRGTPKTVRYWVGRAVGSDDVSGYAANDEIDQVAWVPVREAYARLSYAYDRQTLEEAHAVRKRTVPLVVLRHGEARARSGWHHDDRLRPLVEAGRRQAVAVAGTLAAYGVRRIVTSPSARCVETVAPYVSDSGLAATSLPLLSEEDGEPVAVQSLAAELLDELPGAGGAVLCSHRPVLPWIFEGLGVPQIALDKGEMVVLHVRKGRILATERHPAR